MESVLLTLALLACPVGMGVMMWFMGRGNREAAAPSSPPAADGSLDDLRAEQRRLAAEIDRLDASRDGHEDRYAGAGS